MSGPPSCSSSKTPCAAPTSCSPIRCSPGDAIRAALERGDATGKGAQATLDEIKDARAARPRRRRLHDRREVGELRAPARHATRRRLQCRRGRARHLQGSRCCSRRHADMVFDGMTVAAHGIGASSGLRLPARRIPLPLRQPARSARAPPPRQGCSARRSAASAGFDFDIQVHVGAGSYVCGEASALVESLEGKRGIPRNRPPRLAEKGYLGRPTIVNNVESYCAAALILLHGAEWFRSRGTLAILRHEAALGVGRLRAARRLRVPARRERARGARRLRRARRHRRAGAAARRAPASARTSSIGASPSRTSRPAAPSSCSTSSRDMFEVARHFAHFFAHESCGFCTPCRVGTSLLRNLMDKISDGKGSLHDLQDHRGTGSACCSSASHCGLGESAGRSAARHAAALPPGLRAAPRLARASSRPSTSTARWRGRDA